MIDLHSHIIYGVDDGARDVNDSLALLKEAEKYGVTDILLTPHFLENRKLDINDIKKKFHELENLTNIKLYLGNEICIYNDIVDDLKSGKALTINGSNYVLIELLKSATFSNVFNVIHELRINGYIPIIAHAERYDYYMFDYEFFQRLIDMGCLLQGNYASLYGYYGPDCKKMLKYMLKKRMITFLVSDVHRPDNQKYVMLGKINRKLWFLHDKTYKNALICDNAKRILNSK